MPATRKSTRRATAKGAASKQQSTLSFNHRVTKNSVAKPGKESVVSSSLSKKVEPVKEKDDIVELVDIEVEEEQPETEQLAEDKSEAEIRAEKITDAQIKRYWKGVAAARISKSVHQDDLSLAEKVLRYFDISSQYGPCIGVPRMKRWYRAERLGLNPPIEVLAVLLREENKGTSGIERAAVDRIMESTAIGSL